MHLLYKYSVGVSSTLYIDYV